MIELHDLKPSPGSTRNRRRRGIGPGSGLGKTAGRGSKGQKSRSGARAKRGFEGGQMPLHRRLPKRGFTNIFRKQIVVVNVGQLQVFRAGSSVSPDALVKRGIIKKVKDGVKILGRGEVSKALKVSAHFFSQSARDKISRAGGAVEEIK